MCQVLRVLLTPRGDTFQLQTGALLKLKATASGEWQSVTQDSTEDRQGGSRYEGYP
jgi:hypothetical protein